MTVGVRGRALGLAVVLALGAGAAPAGADSATAGAVLGSFPTRGAAWASWTPVQAGIDIDLPAAMVCTLDGIADGPARLVLPAENAAGARALCRAMVAAGRSCRPMVAPCASDGRVLEAADGARSRDPRPRAEDGPSPADDGSAATLDAWTALAQDLSGWPDDAAPASTVEPAAPVPSVDEATLDAATRAVRAGDHRAAVRLLTPRARAGDPVAAHNLAILLAEGLGTSRDDRAAARWMRLAAEAGLTSAQNTLALMYLHGRGVARDRRAAVRWLAEAARGGHPLARANLLEVMRAGLARPSQSDAAETITDGASAVSAAGREDAGFAGLMPKNRL